MSRLANALQYWLQQSHTQKEFSKATGIDTATTNRLFNGGRGLNFKQRGAIYHAFRERPDLAEALGWLVADLRDNIPLELERLITVRLESAPRHSEQKPRSRKERAKAEFVALLESDDPAAVDLVLSLYDFVHGREKT